MNKTITIIQLLNKIANGEEVPNKIEYQGEVYEWNKEVSKYADHLGYTFEIYTKKIDLHEEVEIIEEQEEIDIQSIQEIQFPDNTNLRDTRDLIINQLVQAVKQLDKKNDN